MTRRLAAALAAVGLLAVVSGCGGEEPPGVQAASSTTTALATTPLAPVPETTTATVPQLDGRAACAEFFGDVGPDSVVLRIGTVLNSIEVEVDEATYASVRQLNQEMESLIGRAPATIATHLRQIQLPLRQIVDAATGGGGSATIDTGAARDGLLDIVPACTAAGYRANG